MVERSDLHARARHIDSLIRELSVALPEYLEAVARFRSNRPVTIAGRGPYRRMDPDNELDNAHSRVATALRGAMGGQESDLARWHTDGG